MSTATAQARTAIPSPAPARARPGRRLIASYLQRDGRTREIVLIPAAAGSSLLVDGIAGGLGDSRLIAHLAADEPQINAQILARMFIADSNRAARKLTVEDLTALPHADTNHVAPAPQRELADEHGNRYRLRAVGQQRRQMRWTRIPPGHDACQVLTLREVIGALEAYEPALSITRAALTQTPPDLTEAIAQELKRVQSSAIVLNRRLREAVLREINSGSASMSEIAIRCGRTKQHSNGQRSGETSWLARRIGLRADPSTGKPTPWIHHQVLALIARQGLGIAPIEVEAC